MVSTAAGALSCLATPGSAASEDPRPGSEEARVCGPGGSRPGLSFPQAGRSLPPGHPPGHLSGARDPARHSTGPPGVTCYPRTWLLPHTPRPRVVPKIGIAHV